MSNKPKFAFNTPAEEAAINAAARSDVDALPLSNAELEHFIPARRPRGRPALEVTKVATNLRLDPDLLDAFKATGPGWQTQINQALREWAEAQGLFARRAAGAGR